jgi:hypothetical protein
VQFVDTWAVRRSVARPEWGSSLSYVGEARHAIARATLLQFQLHLRALAASSASAAAVTAQTYFRYLPPCGIVPLQNAAFPSGFVQAQFFMDLAFGPPRPIAAAQLRSLLSESLGHDAIDLSSRPRLQLYTIAENETAQTSASPPQRVVIFAGESMPYISSQPRYPDLCQVLRDTIDSYVSLLAKNPFFPAETDPRSVAARTQITEAATDAIEVARQRSTLACAGWGLPHDQALAALRDLYASQKRLANTLKTNWSGVPNTVVVAGLGNELLAVLEGTASSLDSMLTAQNLPGAITAQNQIPPILAGWGADAITGTVVVRYLRSTRGKTLVERSGNTFGYIFGITNQTNRRIRLVLSATFMPPKTDWNNSIRIQDLAGNDITGITLDVGATGEAQASIVPPSEARSPDVAQLQFRAEVPGQVGEDDTVDLKVGTAEEPEVPTATIRLVSRQGAAPNNARVNNDITFNYELTFRTPTAPATRQFTAVLRLTTATTADLALFTVVVSMPAGPPLESTPAAPQGTLTSPAFDLVDGTPKALSILVRPASGSKDKTLTMNLEVGATTPGTTPGAVSVDIVVARN